MTPINSNPSKAVKFCWSCGNPIKKGQLFCTKCGSKLEKDENKINIDIENPPSQRIIKKDNIQKKNKGQNMGDKTILIKDNDENIDFQNLTNINKKYKNTENLRQEIGLIDSKVVSDLDSRLDIMQKSLNRLEYKVNALNVENKIIDFHEDFKQTNIPKKFTMLEGVVDQLGHKIKTFETKMETKLQTLDPAPKFLQMQTQLYEEARAIEQTLTKEIKKTVKEEVSQIEPHIIEHISINDQNILHRMEKLESKVNTLSESVEILVPTLLKLVKEVKKLTENNEILEQQKEKISFEDEGQKKFPEPFAAEPIEPFDNSSSLSDFSPFPSEKEEDYNNNNNKDHYSKNFSENKNERNKEPSF